MVRSETLEQLSFQHGKPLREAAAEPGAQLTGRLAGAFPFDDGGIVVIDAGRDLVAVRVEADIAREIVSRGGELVRARYDSKDLMGWRVFAGSDYAEVARRSRAGSVDDLDLRARLFFAVDFGAETPFTRERVVYDDPKTRMRVVYRGDLLTQDDLDVWLGCLSMSREANTTSRLRFVRRALEDRLQWPTTGLTRRIENSFDRLVTGTIALYSSAYTAYGHLLEYGASNGDRRFQATVAGEIAPLVDPQGYAASGAADRARLIDPLAKWLHAHLMASTARVRAVSFDALAEMTPGMDAASLRVATQRALGELVSLQTIVKAWSFTDEGLRIELA